MLKYSKQEENKRNLLNNLISFTKTKRKKTLTTWIMNLYFIGYHTLLPMIAI
jgi:hypothetical protein